MIMNKKIEKKKIICSFYISAVAPFHGADSYRHLEGLSPSCDVISCARIRGRLVHPLTAPPFASICSGHYFVRPTVASLLRISKKRDSPIWSVAPLLKTLKLRKTTFSAYPRTFLSLSSGPVFVPQTQHLQTHLLRQLML